jgi:hypothetical protein
MPPTIEIVSHCWSYLDQYAYLLRLQIQSLIQTPTDCQVRLVVVRPEFDGLTKSILNWSLRLLGGNHRLLITDYSVSRAYFRRRATMRNTIALSTEADVVWFTDCDHCFFEGALDSAIQESLKTPSQLIYPSHVWISRGHELGDELVTKTKSTDGLVAFPFGDFHYRKERKAIGGIQIISGSYCRQHGYLNDTRWIRPIDGDRPMSCRCDAKFRKSIELGSRSVTIPSVYRIRHSKAGRRVAK